MTNKPKLISSSDSSQKVRLSVIPSQSFSTSFTEIERINTGNDKSNCDSQQPEVPNERTVIRNYGNNTATNGKVLSMQRQNYPILPEIEVSCENSIIDGEVKVHIWRGLKRNNIGKAFSVNDHETRSASNLVVPAERSRKTVDRQLSNGIAKANSDGYPNLHKNIAQHVSGSESEPGATLFQEQRGEFASCEEKIFVHGTPKKKTEIDNKALLIVQDEGSGTLTGVRSLQNSQFLDKSGTPEFIEPVSTKQNVIHRNQQMKLSSSPDITSGSDGISEHQRNRSMNDDKIVKNNVSMMEKVAKIGKSLCICVSNNKEL